MISLLTTTVQSLSLRSSVESPFGLLSNKQTPPCATPTTTAPSGSRKHFSDIRRQEYYHLFGQRSRELRVAATHALDVLGNVSGWRMPF